MEDIKALMDESMIYLNDSYKDTPFRFTLMNRASPTLTAQNNDWTRYAIDNVVQYSRLLRVGDAKTLNVYLGYGAGSEEEQSGTLAFVSAKRKKESVTLPQNVLLSHLILLYYIS